MAKHLSETAQNMVLGALVADAATMGLHWIYDQAHIKTIAPQAPEFTAPTAENYKDVPGYFAHASRKIGQQSQYGEQLIVMLDTLEGNQGRYDPHAYIARFRAHFGYGGAFVGYIDHATRDSLDNFRRAEDAALAKGNAIPFDGDPKITTALITKALALKQQFQGDTLRAKFEDAVRITHSDDATVAYGLKVLEEMVAMPPVYGAVDVQLPAIAKLPALVAYLVENGATAAAFEGAVESAIRITSNHDESVDFGMACAHMMKTALCSDDMNTIIQAGRDAATPSTEALLAEALDRAAQDTNAVTKHFGMACDLSYGVPSAVHNLATTPAFQDAVRRNIYAGGDNCGRAMLVGALMGAVHGIGGTTGIPKNWVQMLEHKDRFSGIA